MLVRYEGETKTPLVVHVQASCFHCGLQFTGMIYITDEVVGLPTIIKCHGCKRSIMISDVDPSYHPVVH
jgi:hypothetical protein